MDTETNQPVGFAADDLPLDVFDLAGSGLEIESLTAGLGMPENGASAGSWQCSSCPTCSYCVTCSVQNPMFTQDTAN